MSHDEFTKLFTYMEQKFSAVDRRFDKVETDTNNLKLELAEFSSRLKDSHQEVLVISHQTKRVERWTQQIADQTSTKLSAA
jgi:chromosome segregation ATPase